MAMLAISGIYIGYKAPNTMVLAILLFYVLMNVAYTLWLKRYAIIDVMIISVGFVLRLMVGGAATGIELSHWIVLMTFLLALFLAFAKRRDDLLISQQTGVVVRKNVSSYNVGFLNSVMSIICAVTMMCYIMYTVSPEVIARFGRYLYLTSIFVLAGILRYLQLTHVYEKSGSPTKILYRDRFIQAVIVAWVASFIIIVYAR